MTPDPAALNLAASWAERMGLPVSLIFVIVTGESNWNLDAEGDGGKAHGGLQVRVDVHGHDRQWWIGMAGFERSFALMSWRWQRAWDRFGKDIGRWHRDPVASLRFLWHEAQGANQAVVDARAEAVVRDGMAVYAAWWKGQQDMTVEKPPIQWYPAHPENVLARPAGLMWEGIAIHTTAGGSTIDALASWFQGGNIAAGLRGSTHFGVDRAGRIGQFVSLEASAIAHGQDAGSTAFLVQTNPGLSMNHVVIGIEHLDAGTPGSVTPAQLEASAWLCAWLWETVIGPNAERTGAVLDRDHLVQHRDFAPNSKPLCASWPAQRMDEHIARIQARLTPAPKPPPPPPDDWQARYLQLASEVDQWLFDDQAGAEMREQRLAAITAGKL